MKQALTGILLLSILICSACSSPQGDPSSACSGTATATSSGAVLKPEDSDGSLPNQATQTASSDSSIPSSRSEAGKTTATLKPPASSSGGPAAATGCAPRRLP